MSQPKWKCVANLGDVNPFDYGGLFVYVDETGVYAPEAALLDIDNPDDENSTITVYRFILEPCTYINGILSDNPFHPAHPAWFAGTESKRADRPQDTTYLSNVADYVGLAVETLVEMFCSDDPATRAQAWRAVGDYHGFDNLDHYPLRLSRVEAEEKYGPDLKAVAR